MEGKLLVMFLDLLVLGALGWTVYIMRNLAAQIKIIREGRSELQVLLGQLNLHISNAQASVEGMKKLADEKAKILQKQIEDANEAADELQFIQKASDNVAHRLERLTGMATATLKAEDELRAGPAALHSTPQTQRTPSKAERDLADALTARRSAKALGE
jgi:hypothetical protein